MSQPSWEFGEKTESVICHQSVKIARLVGFAGSVIFELMAVIEELAAIEEKKLELIMLIEQ